MAHSISLGSFLEATYSWNPYPTDLDWLDRCDRPFDSPLTYMLPVLANRFFAVLPLRFILFGAMKHARDGYSVRNAMRVALATYDQFRNPVSWAQECGEIDRNTYVTQYRAGNETLRGIVSALIRICHFSVQDEDYWRSSWNYEEAALELEYIGIREDSEEFDELLRSAAGYTSVRHRVSLGADFGIQVSRAVEERGPSLEREYLGETNPAQGDYDGLRLEYEHESAAEDQHDGFITYQSDEALEHSLVWQEALTNAVERFSIVGESSQTESGHNICDPSEEEELWLLATRRFEAQESEGMEYAEIGDLRPSRTEVDCGKS
ncbi:hypothetical protein AOQ84DRAFT_443876 [Glonium stellatum]|uniref:Uncharacterized protein n=1 Tax=Glonium stellatum TaxID=574774 RepID=A0A8E2JLE5_9PEZI|nr:hypothetical protein AOQ84DRAFT_443876 [Glonium stellatum]